MQRVQAGDKIQANTINNLVEVAEKVHIESENLDVKNYNTGTSINLFSGSSDLFDIDVPTILDVKYSAPRYNQSQDLSALNTIWLQLGRSFDFAKEYFETSAIYIFDDYDESTRSISQQDFNINGTGNFYDGWIDTNIKFLETFEDIHIPDGDGNLYMYDVRINDRKKVVFSNCNSVQKIQDNFGSEVATDVVTIKQKRIATSTPTSLVYPSSSSSDHISCGGDLINLKYMDDYKFTADSEISVVGQKSLQPYSEMISGNYYHYYEIQDFHNLSNQVEYKLSDDNNQWELIVRRSTLSNDQPSKPTEVQYMSLPVPDNELCSFGLSSIQFYGVKPKVHSLWKFQEGGNLVAKLSGDQNTKDNEIKFDDEDYTYQFLVRKTDDEGKSILDYTTIKIDYPADMSTNISIDLMNIPDGKNEYDNWLRAGEHTYFNNGLGTSEGAPKFLAKDPATGGLCYEKIGIVFPCTKLTGDYTEYSYDPNRGGIYLSDDYMWYDQVGFKANHILLRTDNLPYTNNDDLTSALQPLQDDINDLSNQLTGDLTCNNLVVNEIATINNLTATSSYLTSLTADTIDTTDLTAENADTTNLTASIAEITTLSSSSTTIDNLNITQTLETNNIINNTSSPLMITTGGGVQINWMGQVWRLNTIEVVTPNGTQQIMAFTMGH